jgi:hypothetical protein
VGRVGDREGIGKVDQEILTWGWVIGILEEKETLNNTFIPIAISGENLKSAWNSLYKCSDLTHVNQRLSGWKCSPIAKHMLCMHKALKPLIWSPAPNNNKTIVLWTCKNSWIMLIKARVTTDFNTIYNTFQQASKKDFECFHHKNGIYVLWNIMLSY